MARKLKLGGAFERYVAERERLDAAVDAAKAEYGRAMFALEDARRRASAHAKFSDDPLAWANGDKIEADATLEGRYKAFDCPKCGRSGASPDGSCGDCAEGRDFKVLSIYQSV
jgi:hypothetical protein